MVYAHTGKSTDNAFTIAHGELTRQFVAFDTLEDLLRAQDALWEESDHEENLIQCTRQMLVGYLGYKFVMDEYEDFHGVKHRYCHR